MTRLPYQSESRSLLQGMSKGVKSLWPSSGARKNRPSRVKNRLKRPVKSDRDFLRLVRRRRARPSRLNQMLTSQQVRKLWLQRLLVASIVSLGVTGTTWSALFVKEDVTYWGVPYRVVRDFWQDKDARTAYFSNNKDALHDRLQELDIEEEIKDYYRSRYTVRNEAELDRFIHQIMYNHTRYVGEAYRVDAYGILRPI